MSLAPFFEPRTVSLIGAAHSDAKLGGVILQNLLRFRGKVYPVNPKYRELMGLRSYATAAEVPAPVDLSIVIRPAGEIPSILRELKGRTRAVVVVSAGFAETGRQALQEEIIQAGAAGGFRIMGPNCMGIYSARNRLDTLFLTEARLKRPRKGRVAVVSQSGAILSCLFGGFRTSNIGVSRAVNYGNAADVDEADIYNYLLQDSLTDVVISYLESVKDGRRFLSGARELSLRKPLLVLKAGKGESGQAAAFSHTGRLAGRYDVFASVLRQFGLREASDFDELTDMAKAMSLQRPCKGRRVLILTNGGGAGVLAADECNRQGIEVPPLPEDTAARLRPGFADFVIMRNPVDFTAQVRDGDYGIVLNGAEGDFDAFLVIALTGVTGITQSLVDVVSDFRKKCAKPLVVTIASGGLSRDLSRRFERLGVPVYPSPERAVRALKALLNGHE